MAMISFSEGEVKRLILALAGAKNQMPETDSEDEKMETPEHEADPKDSSEDKAEGETPDSGEGKPFGKDGKEESTKDMLARKLKEKGSK